MRERASERVREGRQTWKVVQHFEMLGTAWVVPYCKVSLGRVVLG